MSLCLDESCDPGDLGVTSRQPASPLRYSKLSKSLDEILKDKDALSCFIEFMESRKSGQYIRFWLDAESFQVSTWSRLRSQSLNSARKSSSTVKQDKHTSQPLRTGQWTSENTLDLGSSCQRVTEGSLPSSNTTSSEKLTEEVPNKPITDTGQPSVQPNQSETYLKPKPHSLPVTPVDPEDKHLPGAPDPTCDISDSIESRLSDTVSNSAIKRAESLKKTNLSQDELANKLRKSIARDAVSIFQNYLSHDAPNPVQITDDLRNQCMAKICREDGEVDPACFTDCQEFVLNVMQVEHMPDFTSSEFLCKHQVNILTKGQITLSDILYNDGAMFYFMEYMEQEGGSDLLQFWLATDNFQQHLLSCDGHYDGMQAQSDAMVIYDKYFSLQASHPLGFDDKTRFEVEGNICREEGPLPSCFAKTHHIAFRTIEKSYFPSFLQSEMYYKYLSELVSTVTIATDLPKQSKHKRQDSDASSVHSTHSAGSESIKNTLLAMDSSYLRRTAKTTSRLKESEMNLDPCLLNPDLLWRRPSPGMSLGKVDELGRFVSELDPQPVLDKAKANSTGNSGLFKKRKGKDKEQEDMALQIAQMIISDVTSVTQAIGAMQNLDPPSHDS